MFIRNTSDIKLISLKKYISKIRSAFSCIIREMEKDKNGYTSVLTDNFHLIKRSYVEAMSDLRGIKQLPSIEGERPIIHEYIYNFCRHGSPSPSKESLNSFFTNIGQQTHVTFSEAAAFLPLMKVCCIEIISKNISVKDKTETMRIINRQLDILRVLRKERFSDLIVRVCKTEKLLESEPVYAAMDKKSKSEYRYRIESKAKRSNKNEDDVIAEAKSLASAHKVGAKSHFGYWLYDNKKYHYMQLCLILPVLTAIILGVVTKSIVVAVATVLPLYFILKSLLDLIYSYIVKASYVPRMELNGRAPKTLVCSVTIVDDTKSIDKILKGVEKISVTNKLDGFMFGFLADFKSCEAESSENDTALIDYAKEKLAALERRYGKVFFGAIRRRTYNESTAVYEGKERKRGAICDFITAIKENSSEEFVFLYGDVSDAVYFTALDSDTQPAIGSIKKLVGVLEHPFSYPIISEDGLTVSGGYGIAVPRIELNVSSWSRNVFTRIFGGIGGGEAYSNPSFSVYSNLYDDGIFAGKGVIRIELFYNLLCNQLPDNLVLSHDIVEGGYLRTVYVSDTVFFDSMPTTLFSYLKRGHRWIRGDVQNSYFLKKYYSKNGKAENPLSNLTKFKLLDNIIRGLQPFIYAVCIMLSLINPAIGTVSLIGIFMPFFVTIADNMRKPSNLRLVLFGIETVPSLFRNLLFCLCNLALLPSFAYNSIDATLRSIFRMARKDKARLMEWVTAADADMQGMKIDTAFRYVAIQLVGALLFFSPYTFIVGALWIIGICLPYLLSIKSEKKKAPIDEDKIRGYLKDMWGYYIDFLTPENNYLPPDNFQEEPLNITVTRTSPSNIGLVMLSLLGGYDVGLIEKEELYSLLSKIISSVEKLPKFKGNLYNWYDIRTMLPLEPMFISFVDSGNLAVCFETLKNGLLAFCDRKGESLALRLERLLQDMDLGFMYDKEVELFHIGYDTSRKALSDGHYDLYASEALLSSYYCISKEIVPATHWKNLGRTICEDWGRMYVKSWTGTMFEYYLPTIFLPVIKYTFNEQMLKSVFFAQRLRNTHLPWGNSESEYYLFDEMLYYQYMAFGVQKLALKKRQDRDNVISPYSSFLTLPFYAKASLENLGRLEAYSMYGKYGFYDALDATAIRVGKDPVSVKTYMAHHLSMSFLAAVNALKDNIMVCRFFDGNMSFFSELLEERISDSAIVIQEVSIPQKQGRVYTRYKDMSNIDSGKPNWMALSDKRLNIVLGNNGCGYTEYDNTRLTKYRINTGFANKDCKGIFAAVRNDDCTLCATYAPVFDREATYKTVFGISSALYKAKKKNIETAYTVTLVPNSDCEVRTLSVKNDSHHSTDVDVVFYFEPVLTASLAEEGHPAFFDLFIQGHFDSSVNILSLNRRVRGNGEKGKSISVSLFGENGDEQLFEFEVTRFNVLDGNKGMASFLNAFDIKMSGDFSGDLIPISPCVCLRTQISLHPFETVSVRLVMSVGESEDDSSKKILKLRRTALLRASENLYRISVSHLRSINADRESIKIADLILNDIMNGDKNGGKLPIAIPSSSTDIFKYGLSGDLPIIVIHTSSSTVEMCLPFIKAFAILRYRGIKVELLISYGTEDGYSKPVYNALVEQVTRVNMLHLLDKHYGIFIRSISDISDFSMIVGISTFYADLEMGWQPERQTNEIVYPYIREGRPVCIRYVYKSGIGGYAYAGNRLGFGIDDSFKFVGMPPWCHVLANPRFGTLVSNNNLGCTFGKSSVKYKITPFTNDTIRDNDGEKLLLKLGDSTYDIVKGASSYFRKGIAIYETDIAGIRVRVTVFVCVNLPVKAVKVEFENGSDKDIDLIYSCELTAGKGQDGKVITEPNVNSILVSYPYSPDRVGHYTLMYGKGCIPCDNNSLEIKCNSGAKTEVNFYLGYAESIGRKNALLKLLETENFYEKELASAEKYWSAVGTVSIKTADAGLDLLFNGFLQYQIKASRLFGKVGFYQCSGAMGFRDQLQDTMALAITEPKLLKKQIILCCSKQFEQGDVMHWWFPTEKDGLTWGSRTRSSDDLLWLPLAIFEYTERMDDYSLLQKTVPYCEGRSLSENEAEAYINVSVSSKCDAVYQHGKRAIAKAIKTGPHGLLLFGSGDWNDGMNNVGRKGLGETVWGSFFAIYVLEKFSSVANAMGDEKFAEYCTETAHALRENIEASAWDGQWYRRGYFDNGEPLGSYVSEECRIDILPQAFASICGGFDPSRVRSGLDSVDNLLVDRENKLIKLFYPPFHDNKNNPGYIMSYVPGVRENGGQYTHAAIWYALALIKDGQYEKGYEILTLINPVNKTKNFDDVVKYRVEPYVLAADVYSTSGHQGMGGWTHYTGAAGWYFRVVIQEVFGIKIRGDRIFISPALPKDWREYRVDMNIGKAKIKILVRKARERKIMVDKVETEKIILDGKDHEIVYQYLPV